MNALPLVTVIIPVRNERAFVERSLRSVLAQDYSLERLQVLVVDGMSSDGTRQVVLRLLEQCRKSSDDEEPKKDHASGCCKSLGSIRLLDNPSAIVPTALNIGLDHAGGDIIFRLDGHSEMAPNYISACVAKLRERPEVACVGGRSLAVGSRWIGRGYALALQSPFGVGGRTFRTLQTERSVDTLAFGGYRREVFTKLGGFDPELARNQDVKFNADLRKSGGTLLLIPDTHTLYHAPRTLWAVIRQNYANGRWNTKLLDKMRGALSVRHFVPLFFVLSLAAFSFFRRVQLLS